MRKLTKNEIELREVSSNEHWAEFDILDKNALQTYLEQPIVKKQIIGTVRDIYTRRLYFEINVDDNTVKIGRSYKNTTWPHMANLSLAESLLNYVLADDYPRGALMDLFGGLGMCMPEVNKLFSDRSTQGSNIRLFNNTGSNSAEAKELEADSSSEHKASDDSSTEESTNISATP